MGAEGRQSTHVCGRLKIALFAFFFFFFFLKGFGLVSTFEEVDFQVLKGLSFDCNVV